MTKGDSGGEKHRPSSEERSQKQKLCRYFKNGKCLHGDNCRWSHDLPKDSSKDSQTTGMAAGIRVMTTTTSSSFRVPYFKRVLVDTGANELIRPYSKQWWIDIECNKCKGTRVKMKLAGNVTQPGLMTDIGEVMMRDGLKRNDYDIGWILPVSRIQEELCVEARWRGDGTAALYFPDGKVVELIKEQGLAFMKYEDFWPIRKQLAESHRKGRPSACPRAVCAETNVVYCNHCIASTQTEEDNMWENWIDQKVVEDGNESSLKNLTANHQSSGCVQSGFYSLFAGVGNQDQSTTKEDRETDMPHRVDSLGEAWVHTILPEVETPGDPQQNLKTDDRIPVQVHLATTVDKESAPLLFHTGDEYDRECERCRDALGMRRQHEKGKSESTNVLSADLSGPHPEAVGTKFKYMLVAVFNPGPKQNNLPFVRGISTKSAKEVKDSINSVLAELNSILGEQLVVRLHTDAGKEFVNKAVNEMLRDIKILPTTTGGYAPRTNGGAERYVGLMQQRATSYLIHSKLPLKFWYWAVKQAAYMYRAKALGVEVPQDAPTFGNRVLIRDPKGEDKSFAKRARRPSSFVGTLQWCKGPMS